MWKIQNNSQEKFFNFQGSAFIKLHLLVAPEPKFCVYLISFASKNAHPSACGAWLSFLDTDSSTPGCGV